MKLTKAKIIASKKKDKKQWDTLEYLEQATGENKKTAIKYLRERNDANEKAEIEKRLKAVAFIQDKKKKEEYSYFLTAFAQGLLEQADFDKDWFCQAVATKDNDGIKVFGQGFATQLGVLIIVKDPLGRVYLQAMTPIGEADKDLEMIARFILSAENTMEKYKSTAGTMQDLISPVVYSPTKFKES